MDWIQNICTMFFILKLTLFNRIPGVTTGAVTLKDLRLVCMLDFPFDFNYDHVPPKEENLCTAIGIFRQNPPPSDVDLEKIREGLPLVYNYYIIPYYRDHNTFMVVNESAVFDSLTAELSIKNVDVLVLNFLLRDDDIDPPDDVVSIINSLIVNLREFKKDMLIGIMLRPQVVGETLLEYRLKTAYPDFADFYLVASFDYTPCNYESKQGDMANPPSETDLVDTIAYFTELSYPLDKLFLSIEVVVKSWENRFVEDYEPWSYAYTCTADPGDNRKYCTQSIENLFMQAITMKSSNIPGIFIMSVDEDDCADNCGCGKFAATKAIFAGFTSGSNETSSPSCSNFGKLARDLS